MIISFNHIWNGQDTIEQTIKFDNNYLIDYIDSIESNGYEISNVSFKIH